ncbi:hypothetical protein ACNHE5_05795 [Pandoraea pnomenusa]
MTLRKSPSTPGESGNPSDDAPASAATGTPTAMMRFPAVAHRGAIF